MKAKVQKTLVGGVYVKDKTESNAENSTTWGAWPRRQKVPLSYKELQVMNTQEPFDLMQPQ